MYQRLTLARNKVVLDVISELLLLLLSRFSRVRVCATPQTAAHQAPPVPGILQARTLEWVAISFSNAWKWKVKVKSLSHVWLLATPWTAAYQAPPSMGFSRQEYWTGVPFLLQVSELGSLNERNEYYISRKQAREKQAFHRRVFT